MPTVYITIAKTNSNRGLSIAVDQLTLDLKNEPEPVDIDWELDNTAAPEWDFDDQLGIDIKGHGNKFSFKGKPSAKKFGWTRNRQEPGKKYKYSITLVDTMGTTVILDPYVINN